jgi:hypothetical protein
MIDRCQWIIDGRVLFVDHSGDMTLENMKSSIDAVVENLNQVNSGKRVHILSYSQGMQVDRTLLNLPALNAISKQYLNHPNLGWTFSIGADVNPLLNSLGRIITQVGNVNFRPFSSVDAAMAFIYELEPDLANTPINEIALPTN